MKIFILGIGPLLFETDKKVYGPSLRTWQFTKTCLKNNSRVLLALCDLFNQDLEKKQISIPENFADNLDVINFTKQEFESKTKIQSLLDKFMPDCIVTASSYPSFIASRLNTNLPIWCDFFGQLTTEAQAKANVYNNPEPLYIAREQMKSSLYVADVISTISQRQKYAMIGELGLIGRLNKDTIDYDFVKVIPCSPQININYRRKKNYLRSKTIDEKDFIVLWSGGYNTWVDIHTMFKGLENAMKRNPRIQFVSAGGSIEGHCSKVYEEFKKLIEKSKMKDRFHLLGWLSHENAAKCWQESNLGLNIDLYSYEGLLGGRNRLVDFLNSGLPVITSRLCELSQEIENKKIGLTFEVGDWKKMADLIFEASKNQEKLDKIAKKGKKFAKNDLSNEITTKPLVQWLENPIISPDKRAKNHPLFSGKKRSVKSSFMNKAIKFYDISEKLLLKILFTVDKTFKFLNIVNGEIETNSFPDSISSGKTISTTIQLKNTGKMRWNTSFESVHFIHLTIAFFDDNGNLKGTKTIAYLPEPINRGDFVKLFTDVTAPEEKGQYTISLSLTIPGVGNYTLQNSLISVINP